MSVFRRISVVAVVCLASYCAAQLPDELVAARVLGPHWRQIARASGMIFSGTVLEIESRPAGTGSPLPLVLTTFRVDRAIAGVRVGDVLTVREWAEAWSMHRPMARGQRVLIFLYPPSRLGLTSPVGGRQGQVALDARGEIAGVSVREVLFGGGERTLAAEAEVNAGVFAARLKSCPPEDASQRLSRTQIQAQSETHIQMRSETQTQARSTAAGTSQASHRCGTRSPDDPADDVAPTRPVTLAQLERAIRSARQNPSTAAAAGTKE